MALFKEKLRAQGVVKTEKGITLAISNENMDDIIRIIKSPENSVVLIDRVSRTVKYETQNQENGFLSMLSGTLGA